ncbi:MAG: type II toxin-antitoxin system prevent-host-death family antitoxin [Clostridiales bacterium]|nr:type II toxin-antitoxin system prevent-host-death family antitoxin [Clostridiales bacterium]
MIETATATQMKNNFGRYLEVVMSGGEVIITKNGKEVGRFVPVNKPATSIRESLTGIWKNGADMGDARTKALRKKYEIGD